MHVAKVLVLTSLGLVFVAGCEPRTFVPKSSGSLGLTSDDATLYVADADHDRVTLIDTASMKVLGHVPVGRSPERVLVTAEDTVFVTNRGDRTVTRIEKGALQATATGRVGGEPVGMALGPDGMLLIANSTSGTVSVLDATTLALRSELAVGGTPWAVTVLPQGDRAYVTDLVDGGVSVLDLTSGEVLSRMTLEHPEVTECQWGQTPPTREPAQPADVVLSPGGDRAYIAHVLSRTGSDGTARGMNTLALAVAPAVSTFDTTSHLMVVAQPDQVDPGAPAPMLVATDDTTCVGAGEGMDAPSSLVVDDTGDWIYVADHNSNAVAIISARGQGRPGFADPERGIASLVRVGARPTGLAVRGDLSAAYVHNAFDYNVSVIERDGNRLTETGTIQFAASDLAPDIDRGRRLFYSAVDPRMTEPELGGVSCSSCHPDGRADGLSWSLPAADLWDGAPVRNTPTLWGLEDTAPYNWDGAVQDLPVLSHMMVTYMGGRGLADADARDLVAYVRTVPTPDNPHLDVVPPALAEEGRVLFEAGCASCHTGAALTDNRGYTVSSGETVDTPSLRGVFATPPYLHDGTARTLREAIGAPVVDRGSTGQGHGYAFTELQLEALEAYLKTL